VFTLGGVNGLRFAQLAARAGAAASTVRFHERAGLLSPARRAVNGNRISGESALEELAFIQRAKAIGMSLEDIAGPPSPGRTAGGQSPRIGHHPMTASRLGR